MNYETEIRAALRCYIVENFLYTQPELPFSDDDLLLRLGIIDSLGVMEIVAFVEETWNIEIDPFGITEATFGSIAAIARFTRARIGASKDQMNAA